MTKSVDMIAIDGKVWEIPLENVDRALGKEAKFANPQDEQVYQSYLQSQNNSQNQPNTSHTSWSDHGKEFLQGAARNVGETFDTINKGASAVPMVASRVTGFLSDIGPENTAEDRRGKANLKKMSQATDKIAYTMQNTHLGEDYANADILKTDNNPDSASQIFKAGGEMLSEGVKFATGAKLVDQANIAVNGVTILTQTGKKIAMPWLDKLNTVLSSAGKSVAGTAAEFAGGGMGVEVAKGFQERDIRKPAETHTDAAIDAIKDMFVDMAGFVMGSSVINSANKAIVDSTRNAGKFVVNAFDFISKPSEQGWNKLKVDLPDLVKKPYHTTTQSVFNKMYEKLANNAENQIDEEALAAMERAGINPTALTIYKDNDRIFQIANILPSKLYRTYADNLEKSTLKAIEADLDRNLGVIDPMTWQAEESMIRDASQRLDKVIEKPDLPQIYQNSTKTLEGVLDKNLGKLSSGSGSGSGSGSIQKARDAGAAEIERMINFYTMRKNSLYDMAKESLIESDYVSLDKLHKEAKKLFKKFNVPGTKGTSYGKVKEVAKDVEKGTIPYDNNIPYAFTEEEMNILMNNKKVHPEFLMTMSQGLNEQISEGFVKGDARKVITKLTRTIDEILEDASKNGTIKNKLFSQFKKQGDSYFTNIYKPFIELDATKAIVSGEKPGYIWEQMNSINGRHKVEEALFSLPKGEKLYNVLQRAKAQEYIINYISDGTDISYKKITDLFTNITHEYELIDLLGSKTFNELRTVAPKISSNIAEAQKLLQNPLITDNSVNNIIKLINTREGIELIREQVIKLPKQESKQVMNAVQRVAAKFNIENEITEKGNLNNDKLFRLVADLKNEDYLVGILGKEGLNQFKKDITPLTEKINRLNTQDHFQGGYIAHRNNAGIGSMINRAVSEIGTGVSGYGIGGIRGMITAVLGKNWLAYSFAKAAADPILVHRLIKLGREGNEKQMMSFLEKVAMKSVNLIRENTEKQPVKLYGTKKEIEEGKKLLPDMSNPDVRKRIGKIIGDEGRSLQENLSY